MEPITDNETIATVCNVLKHVSFDSYDKLMIEHPQTAARNITTFIESCVDVKCGTNKKCIFIRPHGCYEANVNKFCCRLDFAIVLDRKDEDDDDNAFHKSLLDNTLLQIYKQGISITTKGTSIPIPQGRQYESCGMALYVPQDKFMLQTMVSGMVLGFVSRLKLEIEHYKNKEEQQ
jgi:hypothetical protein